MIQSPRQLAWEAALMLVVTFVLSYSWMFSSISVPNERSRIYLAVAMADEGTVKIDGPLKEFGRIYDLAKRDGHFYSDKAPGSSFLAAVVYKVATIFTDAEEWPIEKLINLMRSWLMLPIGVFGFLLIRRVLRDVNVDPPAVDLASLGWILGSSAFHYSTAFFGHQIVAVALLAGIHLILRAEHERYRMTAGSRGNIIRLALAGLFLGIAGLTEYQAGIPCVLIAIYLFAGPIRAEKTALLAFAAAAGICVLALLAYNSAAFGGPFELSYHHLSNKKLAELHTQGIGGVTIPTWEYFSGAMFSKHRGLLTTSPFFVMAPLGLWMLFSQRRRLALLFGAIVLFYILFISSSNMWFAGWGFGPRLLVPTMGIMAILAGVAIDRMMPLWLIHGLARGLTLAGVFYHQAIHAFFPEAPDSSENPLVDIVLPMWKEDLVSPNLVEKYTDFSGVESLVPLGIVLVFVAGVILGRGLTESAGRVHKRVLGLIAAALFALAHLGTISQMAGTWTPAKQKKFESSIERWTKHENSLRKRAMEANDMLQTMDE